MKKFDWPLALAELSTAQFRAHGNLKLTDVRKILVKYPAVVDDVRKRLKVPYSKASTTVLARALRSSFSGAVPKTK